MSADRRATIRTLQAQLAALAPAASRDEAVDEAGPLTGLLGPAWRSGGMVELCGPDPVTLSLAAWLAARRDGPVVLIDPAGKPCADAFAALRLDPQRLLIVRPQEGRLVLWAAEQSLRCAGVAATICRVGPRLGTVTTRRLKLASEAGGGIGLVVRPAAREPPFADARLLVRPVRSEGTETLCPRWEVNAVYVRGGTEERSCVVEVTADARLVSVASELARTAGSRRRVGG